MPRRFRSYLLLIVAALAVVFFLYKFRHGISLHEFHWSTVAASLRHARLSLLLVSLVAIYACYALRAVRWVRFCRWLGEAHFGNVYSATLMGFACTFLFGRPGEPVRPVLIARKDSLSIPRMFGVYVIERVFDMAATAAIAIVALLSFERGAAGLQPNRIVIMSARPAGIALLAGLIAAIMFLIYFRHHGGAWLARRLEAPKWRRGWRSKIVALLQGFSEGLQGIRTWSDLSSTAAYTLAHWVLVVLVYWWILAAFRGALAALSLGDVLLVVAFTLVGSAAQLPAVGGGSQAATFVVLKFVLGVQQEPAAVASIVIWLITFAGCCLAGLPLLFREGWSMGELRRMARSEEKAEEAQLLSEAGRAAALKETSE